mmetsp:Transcript_27342/g.49441  ORF Transcript_27342/g.49441 Transcript_27342/m.49441 type:complete len:207 (+) Transcript_27342:1862-2482(+)
MKRAATCRSHRCSPCSISGCHSLVNCYTFQELDVPRTKAAPDETEFPASLNPSLLPANQRMEKVCSCCSIRQASFQSKARFPPALCTRSMISSGMESHLDIASSQRGGHLPRNTIVTPKVEMVCLLLTLHSPILLPGPWIPVQIVQSREAQAAALFPCDLAAIALVTLETIPRCPCRRQNAVAYSDLLVLPKRHLRSLLFESPLPT